MSALSEAGAQRLLGAWSGLEPAPDLFAMPVGQVDGVGRQRLSFQEVGGFLISRVRFGPAPGLGWTVKAVDVLDAPGDRQARLRFKTPARVIAGQFFEYTLTVRAVSEGSG